MPSANKRKRLQKPWIFRPPQSFPASTYWNPRPNVSITRIPSTFAYHMPRWDLCANSNQAVIPLHPALFVILTTAIFMAVRNFVVRLGVDQNNDLNNDQMKLCIFSSLSVI